MTLIFNRLTPTVLCPISSSIVGSCRWRHQWGDVPWKEWYSYEGCEEAIKDVSDRFKRLNHGMWIHARSGSHRKLYRRTAEEIQRTRQHVAVHFAGFDHVIFRMSSPEFRRPKHYAPEYGKDKDPYQPYQRRWGMKKHGFVVVPQFLP